MISLIPLLAVIALGLAVGAAVGKVPIWVSVFLLCIIVLLQVWR